MQPAEFEKLKWHVDAGVAVIEIFNPERRNAWGGLAALEYRWALYHADRDPDIRVVVLTGDGDDFCVGADTAELKDIRDRSGKYDTAKAQKPPPFPDGAPEGFRRNHAYPLTVSTPIITAINGACVGVGFVLATYTDIRFAASDARIKTAFAALGLPAEYGIGWLLPRIVGVQNALQMMYEAEVTAPEILLARGWLSRVTPPDELKAQAVEYAQRLARESSGVSLALMRRQIYFDAIGSFDAAYTRSVEDMNNCLKQPDFAEGLRALKERRAPDFLTKHKSD